MVEQKPANRDKTGRFVKGQSGNPSGRPKMPAEFKRYAKRSAAKLREIADDPETPAKVKADIEKWFAEMVYGKAAQQVDIDGKVEQMGKTVVEFTGPLKDWSE